MTHIYIYIYTILYSLNILIRINIYKMGYMSKRGSIGICIIGYIASIYVSYITMSKLCSKEPLILRTLLGTMAGTIVIFLMSVLCNNSSMYDPYWSVQPFFIYLYWGHHPPPHHLQEYITLLIVGIYCLRLTYHWGEGWEGVSHEDWRYKDFRRARAPINYWIISLLGFHLLPTLLVYLALSPLLLGVGAGEILIFGVEIRGIGNQGERGYLGQLLWGIGIFVSSLGVVIEWKADQQLSNFSRREGKQKQKEREKRVMREGLWAYSRHPNYFGEVSFWWGVALIGASYIHFDHLLNIHTISGIFHSVAFALSGGAAILLLFLFLSVPLMEKRQILRRGEAYTDYINTTSMFVPYFPTHKHKTY